MYKLVIGSHRKLEIGDIFYGASDQHAIPHSDAAFRVIGLSNEDEWIKCCLTHGSNPNLVDDLPPCEYYYEVQGD